MPDPIEVKLQKLRDEYKIASISRRKILVLQANFLKKAQEKEQKKYEKPATYKEALAIFK